MTTNKSDTSVHKVMSHIEGTVYTKPITLERLKDSIALCVFLTRDDELSFEIRKAALESVTALQKLEIELAK